MSVGYKLYREVLAYAPRDWTSGMLVAALVIADAAREDSRLSWMTPAELARKCRMTERGVRKALEKLAENGYEFRVGHGAGKDGREVYAIKGKPIEYAVPDILMVAASQLGPVDNATLGGTTVPP